MFNVNASPMTAGSGLGIGRDHKDTGHTNYFKHSSLKCHHSTSVNVCKCKRPIANAEDADESASTVANCSASTFLLVIVASVTSLLLLLLALLLFLLLLTSFAATTSQSLQLLNTEVELDAHFHRTLNHNRNQNRNRKQEQEQDQDNLWLECDQLSGVSQVEYLAGGWTKAVFRARFQFPPSANEAEMPLSLSSSSAFASASSELAVALKTVLHNSTQIQQCLKRKASSVNANVDENITDAASYDECYLEARQKLVKEALLLSQLDHPGIVKLLGYCDLAMAKWKGLVAADGASDSLILVTELGTPFNLLDLLQMRWDERLKVAISLLETLDYLAQRGLVLNDLRLSQFVLGDGALKLVDLDDLNHVHLSDASSSDQQPTAGLHLQGASDQAKSKVKAADEHNLQNAYRHFFKFILSHGAPRSLRRFTRAFKRSVSVQQHSSRLYSSLLRSIQRHLANRSQTHHALTHNHTASRSHATVLGR